MPGGMPPMMESSASSWAFFIGVQSALELPLDAFPDTTPHQVQINTVAASMSPEEIEKQDSAPGAPRANAIGRMIDAGEIAWLAAFLASDKAQAITGELISPNGGQGNSVYY